MDYEELSLAVQKGKAKLVKELVNKKLEEGATVYDLGIDVPDAKFVEKAEEVNADIVCISALLTTTMPAIGDVISEFEKASVRDKYYIMIGGAPVTQEFADKVHADAYTSNASDASDMAKEYLLSKKSN